MVHICLRDNVVAQPLCHIEEKGWKQTITVLKLRIKKNNIDDEKVYFVSHLSSKSTWDKYTAKWNVSLSLWWQFFHVEFRFGSFGFDFSFTYVIYLWKPTTCIGSWRSMGIMQGRIESLWQPRVGLWKVTKWHDILSLILFACIGVATLRRDKLRGATPMQAKWINLDLWFTHKKA